MSTSDTRDAKKYASIAEVAAAQCKQYTDDARNAPQYADEAKASADASAASAEQSSESSQLSFQSATSASNSASAALTSANNAAASAATAGSAAAAAVQGIYDNFASSDAGKGGSLVSLEGGSNVQDELNSLNKSPNGSSIETIAYGQGASFSTLFTLLGHQSDSGVYFGAQDFTFDPRTRRVYTLTLSGSALSDLATINEFPLDGTTKSTTSVAHTTPASNLVGHQGLGFEPLEDDCRLWTTAYRDSPSIYTGRHAVRYGFTSSGSIYDAQFYLLFGSDFVDSTSCSPTVDVSGRFLIAHGTKTTGTYDTRLRVFDLQELTSGGQGDYSDKYLSEFSTDGLVDLNYPLQGLASDGACIVAYAGDATTAQNKRLYWYDLKTGKVIFKDNSFNVGKSNSAADGAGTRHEPEGLEFLKDGNRYQLVIGVVSGDIGSRVTRLYIADKPLERFYRGIDIPFDSQLGNVFSSVYTPTLANTTNITSSTAYECFYQRVGNVIQISGRVDITPTATSINTELNIQLPVPSVFTSTFQAAGLARTNSATTPQQGVIFSSSSLGTATLRYAPTAIASHAFYFNVSYSIR